MVPTLQGDAPYSGAGKECVGRPHPNHQGGCGQVRRNSKPIPYPIRAYADALPQRRSIVAHKRCLDELDRSLLRAIIEMYNGGPVGLETLAAALGEEAVTLEDLCEPYLMQMGFLTRTPRGRCATRLAYEHLGLKAPESASPEDNGQQSLF